MSTRKSEVTEETLQVSIQKREKDYKALLPSHIRVDRFIKSAVMAIYKSEKLQNCSHASIMSAVIEAAEVGLDFTPVRGHAYMVPFEIKGILEAVFMPGYRGLIDLSRRSGVVTKFVSRIRYEKDEFVLTYGTRDEIIHKPADGDKGGMIGVYAVAHLKNSEPMFEYMTINEINKIRERSKAKNFGPWKTDYEEMCRKTVVRRLAKYLPISVDEYQERFDRAIEADNNSVGFNIELPDLSPPGNLNPEKEVQPQEEKPKTKRGRGKKEKETETTKDTANTAEYDPDVDSKNEEEVQHEESPDLQKPEYGQTGSIFPE